MNALASGSGGMKLPGYALTVLAILGLALVTLLAHGDALSGFWRFDDGWHLLFAASFPADRYFFDPLITGALSGSNVTPWNPFRYDVNLGLFGFAPAGFYWLHLGSLWLIAVASFFLLRLWTGRSFALLGSGAFLLGAPTFQVAQKLMVGHYLDGLLFAILALYGFLRGVREGNPWFAVGGAAFYLLATTCKEIFVPLPGVLLFFREGPLRTRLAFALPYFAWTLGYFLWRRQVLGSFVGGYPEGADGLDLSAALLQFGQIPGHLFGPGASGVLAMALLTLLLFLVWRRGRLNLPLLAVSLLLVLGPLVPLTLFPGIEGPQRYLLLPWWCLAMLVSWLAARSGPERSRTYLLLGLLILTPAALQGWRGKTALEPELHRFEQFYALALSGEPNRMLLQDFVKDPLYMDVILNGAVEARTKLTGQAESRVHVLVDRSGLGDLDRRRYRVWEYAADCECLREIEDGVPPTPGSAGERRPARTLRMLSYGPPYPPYPPLRKGAAGAVDAYELKGNRLSVTGWVPMGDREPEQQLFVLTPERPLEKSIEPVRRSDRTAAPATDWSGFRLTLKFASAEAARRSGAHLCIFGRSALSPPRLLEDFLHLECKGLLGE